MSGIRIEWMELETAFESHAPDVKSWLHKDTGEIVTLTDDTADEERTRVVADPAFVEVEPVPSREQYRMMERFIETVGHGALKDRLQDSIVGKGAFRRFKDVLADHSPEEQARWFAYKDERVKEEMLGWLRTLGIEPVE